MAVSTTLNAVGYFSILIPTSSYDCNFIFDLRNIFFKVFSFKEPAGVLPLLLRLTRLPINNNKKESWIFQPYVLLWLCWVTAYWVRYMKWPTQNLKLCTFWKKNPKNETKIGSTSSKISQYIPYVLCLMGVIVLVLECVLVFCPAGMHILYTVHTGYMQYWYISIRAHWCCCTTPTPSVL